jgi:hypothetical protein
MNSARSIVEDTAGAPGTGAEIVTPGNLPHKRATVTAEVLARLLAGERMTGLEAVGCASTTRLAAVVEYLQSDYGWHIERTDRAAGCSDGRVAWISVYWLGPAVIAEAMAAGAAAWCAEVRAARRVLRAKAALAQRAAARANTARSNCPQSGQWGLFESEGATA